MGKSWDKAIPSIDVWKEALRVLKPGAFAFIMCIPRQDCLARMIVSLEDAGFVVGFTSMYWAYASGFPKAQNIGKVVDKRLGVERTPIKQTKIESANLFEGEREKEIILSKGSGKKRENQSFSNGLPIKEEITIPITPQAQTLDGSYGGFQPKPAVEVILVVMKPLSEKTYVDQALKNGKGVTWLDGGRVPYKNKEDIKRAAGKSVVTKRRKPVKSVSYLDGNIPRNNFDFNQGRFPANLLVSDDALNDGKNRQSGGKSGKSYINKADDSNWIVNFGQKTGEKTGISISDFGSFSRYFSLDAWFDKKLKELPAGVQKTFPFLIVPKASKTEKNRGCEGLEYKQTHFLQDDGRKNPHPVSDPRMKRPQKHLPTKNYHPTVKPLKLFSYLITLGSREGDIILDPFIGSGTTAIAASMLGRRYIGFETEEEYVRISKARLSAVQLQLL